MVQSRLLPSLSAPGGGVAEPVAPGELGRRLPRIAAFCFDRALLVALIAGALLSSQLRWLVVSALLFTLAAQALLLGTSGQSLGRRLLRLQVVDAATKLPAGFVRTALKREVLFLFLSLVPFVNLGAVCNGFSLLRRSRRCLHDEAAGTSV